MEDLVANTQLPQSTIEDELKRLSKAGILRTRDYNTGVTYELQHDAFIRVLRQWRDTVLENDRRRKTIWRALRIASATLGVIILVAWIKFHDLEAKQRLEKLQYQQSLKDLLAQQAINDLKLQGEVQKVNDQKQMEKLQAEKKLHEKEAQAKQALLDGGLLDKVSEEKDAKKRNVLAPSHFDVFAAYEIWRHADDPQSFDKLRAGLLQHAELLPQTYGSRLPGSQYTDSNDAPLTIEYSQSRKNFNIPQFMILWNDYAKELGENYGYPVPYPVAFRPVSDLKAEQIALCLERPSGDSCPAVVPRIQVQSPTYDNQLLVRFQPAELKDARAKEFLAHYVELQKFPANERWNLVPRWSLPVWRLLNQTEGLRTEVATDASGLAAYHVLTALKTNPDDRRAFLTGPAVQALLNSARKSHPAAVDEARAERGNNLVEDLASAISTDGLALLDLPLLLNVLADRRCNETASENPKPGRSQSSHAPCEPQANGIKSPLVGPRLAASSPINRPAITETTDASLLFAAVGTTVPTRDDRLWISGGQLRDGKSKQSGRTSTTITA